MTAAPLASVFLPSYNKPDYVAEAIGSVLDQDCGDFELWVLENSTDDRTRKVIGPLLGDPRIRYLELDIPAAQRESCYITSQLLNTFYPRAEGRFIFYLSDDDLLQPGCVAEVTRFLEEDPARGVCYFSQRQVVWRDGCWQDCLVIAADQPRGTGTQMVTVDCHIDGGQIAYRTSCLRALTQPWFPEDPDPSVARHSDGLFMQKLASFHTFWPLPAELGVKRRSPLSTWCQG